MFGFDASVPVRLLIALAFAGATGLLVWLVEQDRTPLALTTPAIPEANTLPLAIEATFPVSAWSITGGVVEPVFQEAQVWRGRVRIPAGGEVLIEATGAASGFHGLKVRLGTRESAMWGEGTVVGTVRVP